MASAKPNIIFIMADDHAAKAISCYGHGINDTPHLDRIAKEGARLDHCYVTNSICTPSRATILTGVHNHLNLVHTLASKIDTLYPNVAEHIRAFGGYRTGIFGKWHLGEGPQHQPSGFDEWGVLRGHGGYYDPELIGPNGSTWESGYTTDVITDKTIDFMKQTKEDGKPFLVMSHHKAPHAPWDPHPRHEHLYRDEIRVPDTFDDDYKNRAKAAEAANMRIKINMTYANLGLVQPPYGDLQGIGPRRNIGVGASGEAGHRIIPFPDDPSTMAPLVDAITGEKFTFKTQHELGRFKYQRFMQRYLRCVQAIDDNVGRILSYLDEAGLASNTLICYTSDQGYFLGEHGWYDKRFLYEESFQMPFLARGPGITPGTVCTDIVQNVDFAPTWLELAGVPVPRHYQGDSFLPSLQGQRKEPQGPDEIAYHRYWMHKDGNNNAYAHYGCRDKRWKLIFWYNQGHDIPGANKGGEDQEWELFDCDNDPMELFNLWEEDETKGKMAAPPLTEVRERMVRLLERKMAEIGDVPAHPLGLSEAELRERYRVGGSSCAEVGKQGQANM